MQMSDQMPSQKQEQMNWPADKIAFLQSLGEFADQIGHQLYLVGGAVRDLFLKRETLDLDLMLEGDALKFAQHLYEQWPKLFFEIGEAKAPVVFPKFGTAKLEFSGLHVSWLQDLDFCGARQEKYPQPGAQPIVSPGTLGNDLARRDFSINAMAIALSPASFGGLIDYFNGMEHLQKRIIHVLYERSFFEDPARILRAYRYAVRLGFNFSAETKEQIAQAIETTALQTLPRFRLFDEWRKLLAEDCALEILKQPQMDKVMEQTSRLFCFNPQSFQAVATDSWQRKLACLYEQREVGEVEEDLASLGLKGKALSAITAYLR